MTMTEFEKAQARLARRLTALAEQLAEVRELERTTLARCRSAAIRAADKGMPQTQIAANLGVDRMSVRTWLGQR